MKKLLAGLLSGVLLVSSAGIVNAEQTFPTGIPLEIKTAENGSQYKSWTDGVETQASSTLPIMSDEINYSWDETGSHNSGAIYDFAHYLDDYFTDPNAIMKYSNSNLLPGRDVAVTYKFENTDKNIAYPIFYQKGSVYGYYTSTLKYLNDAYGRYEGLLTENGMYGSNRFKATNKEDITSQLDAKTKNQIQNLLRLGYVELKDNDVRKNGTATYMMSNLDSMLSTQINIYSLLNKSNDKPSISRLREEDGWRTAEYLEASIKNLGLMKDEDLTMKLKQEGSMTKDNDYYRVNAKLTVPFDKDTEIWDIKAKTLGEHRVFAEAKASLDKNIAGAKLIVTPMLYEEDQWKYGTPQPAVDISKDAKVDIKQGDKLELLIPKSTNEKSVKLIANGGSDEYDFKLNEYKIEPIRGPEERSAIKNEENEVNEYNQIVEQGQKGLKYLEVTGVKKTNETGEIELKLDGNGGNGGTDTDKDSVILASGHQYTDVLTATVLANEKKSPILLSELDQVSDNTLKEIKRLKVDEVIISGGPLSVSNKVVTQLEKEGYDVRRIYGQNRYETAKKIGQEVRLTSNNMKESILVDGTNFPDVITLSSLANQKRAPILLTEPNKLNTTTEKALDDWNIDKVTIGGQKLSVSQNVEDKVKTTVSSVNRIGGQNRYETAYKVADEVRTLTNNKKDMILVDGTDFPDGITISSLSAKFKAPILLTTPKTLHPTTAKAINDWTIENILIGGGYNSVSKSIEDNLNVSNKARVAGGNRYDTAVEISKRYTDTTSLVN
ncbi:MAG: cell wall-binding repeat-containing protein [Peptostreptococcus sp.]|uniref:cell wall-binding repeat-containing protein n=1 Tax=Peptostreptococcus sp. TaxID=1262 RepID=UPI002FC5D095